MEEMDREAVVEAVLKYKKVMVEAERIATEVAIARGIITDEWHPDEVEIEDDQIDATFYFSFRCNTDYEHVSFPLSYLWDDDWVVKEEEAIRLRNEAAAKKEEEKERKRLAEQEARERAQLERLKAKYEEDNGQT